ncbi:MAG: BrnT family toxin [Gammaproteobacteria bacterium]|nr:BrnT family toxin [Gammaproteobacteria bacterium]
MHPGFRLTNYVFNYHFEWDAAKAASNQRKHNVSFDIAATVFLDPLMLSMPDDEHSHANTANVRMVSARAATKHEQHQYEVNE